MSEINRGYLRDEIAKSINKAKEDSIVKSRELKELQSRHEGFGHLSEGMMKLKVGTKSVEKQIKNITEILSGEHDVLEVVLEDFLKNTEILMRNAMELYVDAERMRERVRGQGVDEDMDITK